MGKHPLNLALRFALELCALFGVGLWAWNFTEVQWLKWLLLIISLASFMLIWVTFNVPGDPSRSGKAPVPVKGWLRLLIEICLFFLSLYALYLSDRMDMVRTVGILLIIHYLLSYDRIAWMLKQ